MMLKTSKYINFLHIPLGMCSKYEEAVIFASQAHSGQFRKIKKTPYIIHPLNVSEMVLNWFPMHSQIETMRIVAILHDLIEDTWVTKQVIKEKFGETIAEIVDDLSLRKCNGESSEICYNEYINRLASSSDQAKIIKLADIWCNFKDTENHPRWLNFYTESKRMLESLEVKDELIKALFDEKKKILLEKADNYLKMHKNINDAQ